MNAVGASNQDVALALRTTQQNEYGMLEDQEDDGKTPSETEQAFCGLY